MRVVLKILAAAAVVVVVVLIAGAIAIATVDVDTLIGPVKARVKEVTGRDLAIRGGADLSFSLEPKLVLKDVALANAPWGKAPALVSAQRLELRIALLPLLSRRFELIELALVGPVIALETDSAGRGNWDLGQAATLPPAAAGSGAVPATFTTPLVSNLSVTGGSLTYRDAGSGHVTRIAIDKLALRSRDAQSPIAAQFSGKVDDVTVAVEGTLGSLDALLRQRWPYPVALKGTIDTTPTEVAAKISKENSTYVLNDLDLRVGTNAVGGKFSIVTGGARPKLVFGLAATRLAVADLPLPRATPGAATPTAARGTRIFSATPVDLSILRMVDADGRIAIGTLRLPNGRELGDVKVQLALVAGRLDITDARATMFGGTLAGSLAVDAAAASPSVRMRADGNGLDLGAVLTALGAPREVRGGKTELNVDLAMRGNSPQAWAGSANGSLRVVVGRATLTNPRLDLTSSLDKLFGAVNPFRASDPATELVCAVIRLPFANGIARVDRTVAFQTSKLGVLASGTLNLRDETIDFAIQPKVHSSIPVDFPRLTDLVRFSGPMTAPQVQVDAKASVAAIASVGAAVSTGGLSAIGQALWAKVEDGGATPCQIALGQKGATTTSTASARTAGSNPLDDVGKALGRIFGK